VLLENRQAEIPRHAAQGPARRVQAVSDGAYRVRGQAKQGQVLGWVEPKYLSPLKPEFLREPETERRAAGEVEALIARNEVAINMTPEEVTRALASCEKDLAAGRDRSARKCGSLCASSECRRRSPPADKYGRLVTNYVYVKGARRKVSVPSRTTWSPSSEQSEGTLDRAARVKIVAVPFRLSY
jgi:hypothetical protein